MHASTYNRYVCVWLLCCIHFWIEFLFEDKIAEVLVSLLCCSLPHVVLSVWNSLPNLSWSGTATNCSGWPLLFWLTDPCLAACFHQPN